MKKYYIIAMAVTSVILIPFVLFSLFFSSYTINIKTEYGDEFSVLCDDSGDLYTISDVNSSFDTDLYYFSDKKQFHSICDNQYIRCYNVFDCDGEWDKNKLSGKFIIKIKKHDKFFAVRYSQVKYSSEYMFIDEAEKVKSEFLCDSILMKLCIDDMDYHYHDEMIEIGNKLINQEYEELEQYGLTKEMISDTESLKQKIQIMKNYLKKQGLKT